MTRDAIVASRSPLGSELSEILRTPFTPGLQPLRELRFRFPPREVRSIRVIPGGPAGQRAIHELRVYREGVELPRRPEWCLRTRLNPVGLPSAFDNSPVTRWHGGDLEVDFGQAERIDTVVLECPPDQPAEGFRLNFAGPAQTADVPPPPGMRRSAAQELTKRGIRYLIVTDADPITTDLARNGRLWGIRLVAREPGAWLFEFDFR